MSNKKGFERLVILVGFNSDKQEYLGGISDFEKLVTWAEKRGFQITMKEVREKEVFVLKNENASSFDSVAMLNFDKNGQKSYLMEDKDLFFDRG